METDQKTIKIVKGSKVLKKLDTSFKIDLMLQHARVEGVW